MHRGLVALLSSALLAFAASPARAGERVSSGPAVVTVATDPLSVTFEQRGGVALRSVRGLAVVDAGGATRRAVRARGVRRDGSAVVVGVELEGGGGASLRLAPDEDGVLALEALAPGAREVAFAFAAEEGERFFGSGERSDAVDRGGLETENHVSDGPFREEDRRYVQASTPPWAQRERDDATYYPVPWLLSSRGWGVQVDEDATSRMRARTPQDRDRWSVEVDGSRLRLRLYSGPTPADALGRFTNATGRQPAPQAPWTYGPWFQTGQPNVVAPAEEQAIIDAQRDAGAPVSVGETQMHHLPCGAHEARRAEERERNARFHRAGLARLVYFNPSLCSSYTRVYDRARSAGILQKGPAGEPFAFPAFVGGSGPLGFTQEPLAQFDFTHPATEPFYAELLREAVDLGADGWMEDFGEGTPTAGVVQHDGSRGDVAHNRYPTDYHCTVARIVRRFDRPLVRHQRSGWTGSARCAEVVWGGDPTTVWGFDGLSSAVKQVLSIGLSGVSRWGTDIGGYNSFGSSLPGKPGGTEDETLTREMLTRWIELGALIPVMRTKRSGIALPPYARPQVFDPETLPVWRRLTQLHQQLNPYLLAADDEHRRTGLPIVRHLVLAHPELAAARTADDEYLFGPDLLAAPVTAPGLRARRVYLPPGEWVDFWGSTRFDADTGGYHLGSLATRERGDREVRVAAPLGEPPLKLRVGAVLPLLPAGIDTLAPYGAGGKLTRLADRPDRTRLLAVPRGRSFTRLTGGATVRSVEGRRGWVLRVRGGKASARWDVEASLRALRRPVRPRRVLVDGRRISRKRWSYAPRTGVLRVEGLRGARLRLDVRG